MSRKNQPSNEIPPLNDKDEALFEALGKSKKKKKRKIVRTIVSIVKAVELFMEKDKVFDLHFLCPTGKKINVSLGRALRATCHRQVAVNLV